MLITSLAITAEFVGTNVESSAFIYGAMSFTDKLSTGMFYSSFEYEMLFDSKIIRNVTSTVND